MARRLSMRPAALALVAVAAACDRTATPGVARGKALFRGCAPCHGELGTGNQALGAPAIAGLPQWYVEAQLQNFQAGRRGGAPFDTTGIRMKSMAWTVNGPGDVASVAAYVASLPSSNPVPVLRGDTAAGHAAFAVCSACHGPNAEGMEPMHAPPLAGRSDWYLLAQLHKFRAGWRGTDSADVWGQVMRPNALPLDDAAMVNVLAYLQNLRQEPARP